LLIVVLLLGAGVQTLPSVNVLRAEKVEVAGLGDESRGYNKKTPTRYPLIGVITILLT
jgi:hypothetical protein